MFICTGCQKKYENQTKFCSECGGKVEEKIETAPPVYACSQCGKEYDGTTKFCNECGGKVISKTATVQPATVQPVAVQPVPGIDKETVKKNKIKSIASIIGSLLALGCAIGLPLMNKYIAKITKENQEAAVQTLKKLQKAASDDDIKKLIIPSARDNRKLFKNISKLNMIMLCGDKVTFSDYKVKPDKQVAVKVSWSHSGGTGSAAVLVTKEKDQWFISDCTDVKDIFD